MFEDNLELYRSLLVKICLTFWSLIQYRRDILRPGDSWGQPGQLKAFPALLFFFLPTKTIFYAGVTPRAWSKIQQTKVAVTKI